MFKKAFSITLGVVSALLCLFFAVFLLHVAAIVGIYTYKVFHSHPSERPAETAASAFVEPRTYTVRSGDSIASISQAFDVSAKELRRLNHLDEATKLEAGALLYLPAAKKTKNAFVRL